MAVRTVSQTGPISASSTFGGSAFSNGDSVVNDAGNNFTLTIDQNATVAGFSGTGGNGTTVVSSGVTLTLTGNVTQGNKNFTLGSGTGNAHLVFDCTAADRKFLFGDVASFSTYADCKLVVLGTSGAHCTISKTGGNYCWFDDFSENSGAGAGKTGYTLDYCDLTGIGKSDGSVSLGVSDFGAKSLILRNCVFDGCATVFPVRPYGYNSDTSSFVVEDCRWLNSTSGSINVYAVMNGALTSGTKSFKRNSCDKTPTLGAGASPNVGPEVEDCYFDAMVDLSRTRTFDRCVIRHPSALQTVTPYCDLDRVYFLADNRAPGQVGNQHFCAYGESGHEIHHCIFEYPHATAVDGPDPLHGALGTANIHHILVIPAVDGYASGNNIVNPSAAGVDYEVTLEHCTIVGLSAYLILNEAAPSAQDFPFVRSNLVSAGGSATGDDRSAIIRDITATPPTFVDDLDPTTATHNYLHNYIPYTHAVTGLTHDGFVCKLSQVPTGNIYDNVTGPQFVDDSRNAAKWAVSIGAAASGDTLVQKLDAARAALLDDPTLGADLFDYVWAGFAPQNPALLAAHDAESGGWIGAVEGVASGNRRRRVLLCGGR